MLECESEMFVCDKRKFLLCITINVFRIVSKMEEISAVDPTNYHRQGYIIYIINNRLEMVTLFFSFKNSKIFNEFISVKTSYALVQ